jgi:hypothetical protein
MLIDGAWFKFTAASSDRRYWRSPMRAIPSLLIALALSIALADLTAEQGCSPPSRFSRRN